MALPSSFQWPWQYDFPPFFTIQPNTDTRRKQLDAWCDLVLAYHRTTKSYLLDVNEALSSPLFYNSKINSILIRLPFVDDWPLMIFIEWGGGGGIYT